MQDEIHRPVLLSEVIENLIKKGDEVFLDATLGCGGHSLEILRRFPKVTVIGMDVDDEELDVAKERLKQFEKRVTILKENFRNMDKAILDLGIKKVDAILLDLGLSSFQLKAKRGFSFLEDSFLDMRMDLDQQLKAYDVINRYPFEKLLKVIRDYGEEEDAEEIVRRIIERRRKAPIETARELSKIVEEVKGKRGRIHPATKVFQSIRIEVNRELDNLREGLKKSLMILRAGGRVGVITFHSLEDRTVKDFFKNEKAFVVVTKKPIRPKPSEIAENPRARSAKLRIAERRGNRG